MIILFFLQLFCFTSLVTAISPATQNLRTAIRKRDLTQMALALQQNANVHEEIDDSNALVEAVLTDFVPGVILLLRWSQENPHAGAFDPYIIHILLYLLNEEDTTQIAAVIKALEQYQEYLLNSSDINSVLLKAVTYNDISLVKQALEQKADIHFQNNACQKIAAIQGNKDIVRILLQHSLLHNTPYSWKIMQFLLEEIKFMREKTRSNEPNTVELMIWRYQFDLKK